MKITDSLQRQYDIIRSLDKLEKEKIITKSEKDKYKQKM